MTEPAPLLPLLSVPADGIPALLDSREALDAFLNEIDEFPGPVALDTERAQGFRYGGEAWLVQIKLKGGRTVLIDPSAFDWDLSVVGAALADREWILHAASQDLPCLEDSQMSPTTLFDTELAARLLNDPRVGLGALVESQLGVRLAKEHSAADWSQRPLPEEMRAYAALDVELLHELRDAIAARLQVSHKWEWAQQEFAALVATTWNDHEDRVDPWRRTKGLSSLTSPAQLALVRELWQARDEIAQELDKGPARILPDAAIVDAAALVVARGKTWPEYRQLRKIEGFRRRLAVRFTDAWVIALDRATEMSSSNYPPMRASHEGPSRQPRNWQRHHPEKFERWQALRPIATALSEQHDVPAENLLSPAALRALAWDPPKDHHAAAVAQFLRDHGAREWQVGLCAEAFAEALSAPAPLVDHTDA